MPAAEKGAREEERLAALYDYDILDTPEEKAFDDITRLASYICQTPVAVISLVDRDRQFFKSEVGFGARETSYEASMCAHNLSGSDLLIVTDTEQDTRFVDNPLVTSDPHVRFYAGAPLQTPEGYTLGAMCVLDKRPRTLTQEQQEMLGVLARQVMSLMELRRRYARERNIAETLQRAMLAKSLPGQFPGLVIESRYEAAQNEAQVGGDFFDSFALPDGRVALVVGDVAGKGLAAASRTAEVKTAFRVYLRESDSIAQALMRLNRFLIEMKAFFDRAEDGFIAFSVAVLEPQTGKMEAASAGAECPLIARSNGGVEAVGKNALPLGVEVSAEYQSWPAQLDPDDFLILLTDGITEARHGWNFFGSEGVAQTLEQAAPFANPHQVATRLLEAARTFARGVLRDDVCILVATRTGAFSPGILS